MWFDEHPYLIFYLVGFCCAVFLILVKIMVFSFLNWITKTNILNKNLKKILPPNEETILAKWIKLIGVLAAEAALSWINVIVSLFQIVVTILRVLREAFSSVPEEVKLLRFPLKNNPDMARESVWAYLIALNVKTGEKILTEIELISNLDEVRSYYPSFDYSSALKQLDGLNIISSENIYNAQMQLQIDEEGHIERAL